MVKHIQYEIDWTAPQTTASATGPSLDQHELLTSTELPPRPLGNDSDADDPSPMECSLMPNPVPLLDAVGRAAFGVDEDGNVNPGPEEVAAITEYHTERLVKLLDEIQNIDDQLARASGQARDPLYRQRDNAHSGYLGALALYCEDFGDEAARQLDTWARYLHRCESENESRSSNATQR